MHILSKAGEFVLEGTLGQESVPFDGRIGEKALAPGHYLLILEERDLVGRPSNTTALRFRILPAR